jgi:large subunit ribosomal protein L11
MAKKILTTIKLQALAGKATPAPPIGPILGQHGIDIAKFCQEFNAKTSQEGDLTIPVELTVYQDRSFDFVIKTPPTAALLKKATNIEKGSAEPQKNKVTTITNQQIEEIAKKKLPDLNTTDLVKAKKTVAGTARGMGMVVKKK